MGSPVPADLSTGAEPLASSTVAALQVREELDRILSHSTFAKAPRLSRFLRFIVEKHLDGDGEQLKEWLIATEVYGKPTSYDPTVNSLVRVEATRLRARLDRFYELEGSRYGLRICLPKGAYTPVFSIDEGEQEARLPSEPPGREVRVSGTASARHASQSPRRLPRAPLRSGIRVVLGTTATFLAIAAAAHLARPSSRPAAIDEETLAIYSRALQQRTAHDPRLAPWKGKLSQSLEQAITSLEEVTERAPSFVPAWASLAEACHFAANFDRERAPSLVWKGLRAGRRALELDPANVQAHAAVADLLFRREWDLRSAEDHYRRALAGGSGPSHAAREFADLLRLRGRAAEATATLSAIQTRQPETAAVIVQSAFVPFDARDFDEAVRLAQRAISLKADLREAHWLIGLCYEQQGRFDAAEKKYRQVLAMNPRDGRAQPALAHLLAHTGRAREARAIAAELQERAERGEFALFGLAIIFTAMSDHESALRYLEASFERKEVSALYTTFDPRLRPLAYRPRFQALVRRLEAAGIVSPPAG